MRLLRFVLSVLAHTLPSSGDPQLQQWTARVGACLQGGAVEVLVADERAAVLAFACGAGDDQLVVMANGSDAPQRVRRAEATPLVPLYATNADVAAIPSLLITLFEAGGVVYSNEIPARTAVVFRPAEAADVRPRGLEE
jgi:hypothetical protein